MEWNCKTIATLLHQSACSVLAHRDEAAWDLKDDGSLVTKVDTANEKFLRERLTSDGSFFLGEETIYQLGEEYVRKALAGTTYVVDPIDGTAPFAHRWPTWAISVGKMVAGTLVDGAVILPDFDECLMTDGPRVLLARGIRNAPETWTWQELTPPPNTWSPGSMIITGQDYTKKHTFDIPNPIFAPGSAVQSLAGILTRRAIAYIGHMKLWDLAGILPMLERLGVQFMLFDGTPVTTTLSPKCFLMDLSSPKCWHLTQSILCAMPEVCKHLIPILQK